MSQDINVAEPKPLGMLHMALLALAVGVIAGLGAVVFRGLIGLFHNLLFLGELSVHYDANVHTPVGPWGMFVILVPVVGAVGVAFLVKTFAPEAKGHGVPEVMDAIYYNEGRIRPVVAAVKSVASALSIGSGGSVGREGPIIQIGAAFGSTLGQLIRMPVTQRVTLIAAGAGGGIAATFNTPIGGLAFAAELMLPAIHATTLLPVALSTVTATYIGRYFLGLQPAFNIPELAIPAHHLTNPVALPLFAVFGLLIGLVATLFVRSIYWFEDRFDALPGNYYTRHMLGMLAVGVSMYVLMTQSGHYYVQGVGYATIEDVLHGTLNFPAFLLLLVVAKLLVTCLTLGSGASGGVFSPALFIGATLGGVVGTLALWTFPGLGVGPAAFAVAGMAAMIGGTTGAIVTAITMLFEMTRDYNAILPIILTVTVSYIVRKRISNESIYTLKLLRRGHVVPEGLQAALDAARRAKDVMTRDFAVLSAEEGVDRWPDRKPASTTDPVIVLQSAGAVAGVLPSKPVGMGSGASAATLGDWAETDYVFVAEGDSLIEVLAAMRGQDARIALVTRDRASRDPASIVGVITDRQIASVARTAASLLG
jgi:CIC family chloride channel protein